MTELADLDWHTIEPQEIYQRLSTSLTQGLSIEQATRRLAEYGKNMPSAPPTHRFKTVFGYFFKGFGSILLVGASKYSLQTVTFRPPISVKIRWPPEVLTSITLKTAQAMTQYAIIHFTAIESSRL